MSDTAIKIEHVSKEYRLGAIGGTTLRDDLQRLGAKLRKKEDPTKMIGAENEVTGERFLALNDISFEVKKGEALGIIGHNGAGKSTLLKLLSRITVPTSGTISYNGRVASMLEVGTGFHPELTGRENVYMNGAILGMTKAEITEKFDEIVSFAEMERFIDTPVKRYSSGMYVKLAFSVAAHLDSEIMVMDEVLAVGDMKFQQKCLGRMSDAANSEGRTVLYVSHNMNTIRQLCSRCIVLDHGKVIFDGDVDKAINIYMSCDDSNTDSVVDLSKALRPTSSYNLVRMKKLSYLDKDNRVYVTGQKVKFNVEWESFNNLEDVRFRAIIRYQDDSPVGMVTSPVICSLKRGESYSADFEFDTSMLTEGRYQLSIAFFQRGSKGESIILDHVTRATTIEIINDLDSEGFLDWEHRWWGSVKFPELNVKGVKKYGENIAE